MRQHAQNPFHRIETWSYKRRFWERGHLGTVIGFALNLGHLGKPCQAYRLPPCPMTIVHDHGIIPMKVRFCGCTDQETRDVVPDTVQLLRFGLFPGSWERPETAFTMNALRSYHLLSLQCGVTGLDYTKYLRRCTDMVNPDSVTVGVPRIFAHQRSLTHCRIAIGSSTTQCASSPFCGLPVELESIR